MGNKSSSELKDSMKEKLQHLNLSSKTLPTRPDNPRKQPLSTSSLRVVTSKEPTARPRSGSTLPARLDRIPPPVPSTPTALSTLRVDTPTLLAQPPSPEIPTPSAGTVRPPSVLPAINASPFTPPSFANSLPKSENSTITPGTLTPTRRHALSAPTFTLSPPPSSGSTFSNQRILSPPTSSHSSTNGFPAIFPLLPITAPPLTDRHYNCYQSHRRMLFSKNEFCPVPCMLCKREDKKGRWTCSWCSLRVCSGCKGHVKDILGKESAVNENRNGRNGKEKEAGDNDQQRTGGDGDDATLGGSQETVIHIDKPDAKRRERDKPGHHEEDSTWPHQ